MDKNLTLVKYKQIADIVAQSLYDYKNITGTNYIKLCGGKLKSTSDMTQLTLTKERLELANSIWKDLMNLYKYKAINLITSDDGIDHLERMIEVLIAITRAQK